MQYGLTPAQRKAKGRQIDPFQEGRAEKQPGSDQPGYKKADVIQIANIRGPIRDQLDREKPIGQPREEHEFRQNTGLSTDQTDRDTADLPQRTIK
jgi:hypothetical protein